MICNVHVIISLGTLAYICTFPYNSTYLNHSRHALRKQHIRTHSFWKMLFKLHSLQNINKNKK